MIIDHQRETGPAPEDISQIQNQNPGFDIVALRGKIPDEEKILRLSQMQDSTLHHQLGDDLVEHLWSRVGNEN